MTRPCFSSITCALVLVCVPALRVDRTLAARYGATCVVEGTVTDAASGLVVGGVTVRLNRLGPGYAAVSDAEGRFLLAGVEPANYTMSIARPAFVLVEPAKDVRVACADTPFIANVVIVKGAVIAGQISDDRGEPVSGASVQLSTGQRSITDAGGEYRFYGLHTGDYVISAAPPKSPLATSGTVDRTTAENDRLLSELASGRFGNEEKTAKVVAPPVTGAHVASPTSYFPGTTRRDDAVPVKARAGEALTGVNFALASASSFTMSGVVMTPTGAPASAALVQIIRKADWVVAAGHTTAADGRFIIPSLMAGQYRIWVRTAAAVPEKVFNRSALSMAQVAAAWADLDVTISGDLPDVTVQLQPTGSVTGHVVVQAEAGTRAPAWGRVRVRVAPAEKTGNRLLDVEREVGVSATGQFQLDHVAAGHLRFTVIVDGEPRWSLVSVTVDGAPQHDGVVAVPSGQLVLTGVTLTVGRR